MATEKKPSQRDLTLIRILERLSDQIQHHDTLLEEMTKSQQALAAELERADLRQNVRHDATNAAIEKLEQIFQRYRSDMIGLVREQDRIDESMIALSKRQETIAGAQEDINRDLSDLDGRFVTQEKTSRDHFEFSARHGDAVLKEIANASRNAARLHTETEKHLGDEHRAITQQLSETDRNIAKLHIGTEKNLGDEHREITRLLSELRQETKRRLLALDGIEASLQVLMIRTEPPKKKPFIIVRIIRGTGGLFRFKLPEMIKRIRLRLRKG
ncbi:MAG: hypothetical protein LBH28_11730 [Oscillospiraceae bacterium]|nr:hypothetical protein [Oscillospiraceae bacterium]